MNEMIWNLFLQTGNVETYLLLKQLEDEQLHGEIEPNKETKGIAPVETNMQ